MTSEFKHNYAQANGIRIHYVEIGEGPPVVLLHGFPECWYAWRHQLPALAAAGFRAVAPDMRGYGRTDCPGDVEAYDIFQLAGDIVGLVNALAGKSAAAVVGHDWGSWIACHLALLRSDLFRGLALLSVPYAPRRKMNQTDWEQKKYPGKVFYQAVLRSPMASAFLEANVRATLCRGFYQLSGEAAPQERWSPVQDPGALMTGAVATPKLPSFVTEQDLDFVSGEFEHSRFTGGLNYYRNMDRNWAATPFLDGAKIVVPTLFVGGEKDPVMDFMGDAYQALEVTVPNLRRKVVLPGVGHWIQQESPEAVNRLLVDFLKSL